LRVQIGDAAILGTGIKVVPYLVLVSNDSITRPSQRICKPRLDNFSPRLKDIVS